MCCPDGVLGAVKTAPPVNAATFARFTPQQLEEAFQMVGSRRIPSLPAPRAPMKRMADRAKEEQEADRLIRDAKILDESGVFAIVLEKIPASLAEKVAKTVHVPVIGIGAGGGVDGQVLVVHDMLGITQEFSPRFLRRYAHIGETMHKAVEQYVSDVKSRDFPNASEQY